MDAEERARELSPCTCGKDLPARMRERGLHFANCPAENQPDIADAIAAAYNQGLEDAAKVADDLDDPEDCWRIAAAIRALKKEG